MFNYYASQHAKYRDVLAALRRLRLRPTQILDVGCGYGWFVARLREAYPEAEVWGLDNNEGNLCEGLRSRRLRARQTIYGDITEWESGCCEAIRVRNANQDIEYGPSRLAPCTHFYNIKIGNPFYDQSSSETIMTGDEFLKWLNGV